MKNSISVSQELNNLDLLLGQRIWGIHVLNGALELDLGGHACIRFNPAFVLNGRKYNTEKSVGHAYRLHILIHQQITDIRIIDEQGTIQIIFTKGDELCSSGVSICNGFLKNAREAIT